MTLAYRCPACGTFIHRTHESCPGCKRPRSRIVRTPARARLLDAYRLGYLDAEEGFAPHGPERFAQPDEAAAYRRGLDAGAGLR